MYLFVVVAVFSTPLTRNRRFADAMPDSEYLHLSFSKDLPSEIAVLGFHFGHLASPLQVFLLHLLRNSSLPL